MDDDQARAAARTIEAMLARSSLPCATHVWRGLAGGNAVMASLAELEPGDEIGHDVFTPTSRSRSFVVECLMLFEEPRFLVTIKLPEGARALDIAEISVRPDEQEVLLQREHRSTVRLIVDQGDYTELVVDVHADA